MKLIKLWLPVILWAGLIFFMSSQQSLGTDFGIWDFILRKCAHVFEYLVFTAFLWRAFSGTVKLKFHYTAWWVSLISVLYAVSDEVHQYFVPTRHASFIDVFIDSLGIIIFIVFIHRRTKF